MNPLITTIKSKFQTVLCIVLATLLTASYLSGSSDRTELEQVSKKLTEHVQLNERLSEQNLLLAEEAKTRPEKIITVVKEVDKEVCNGIVRQQLINNLPTKIPSKEVVDEKTVADIDDRLPDNLIKLLK